MTLRFENPWCLLFIVAVGLPWLLRWFQTRNVHTLFWGAMQFVEATLVRQAAQVRRRDRRQLLVRMALIVATVLAVAKPVWAPRQLGLMPVGQQYVLLLFDDSYSMQMKDGELPQFEVAKQQALQWMEQQDPQTHYSVLTFSETVRLGERAQDAVVYSNADAARDALHRLRVGYRSDSFAEVLPAIQALMKTRAEPVKQVCVFTDGQRQAWEDAELTLLGPEIPIRVILPARRRISNLSLVDFWTDRAVYAVGEPVPFHAKVSNNGSVAHAKAVLRLNVRAWEDESFQKIGVLYGDFSPGSERTLEGHHVFHRPGIYALQAELHPDDLDADNRRYQLVEIVPSLRVLCVGDETRYVAVALAPGESGSIQVFSVTSLPRSLLPQTQRPPTGPAEGEGYDAVILGRPWDLREERLLEGYLTAGGVVCVLAGPDFGQEGALDAPWLPAELQAVAGEATTFQQSQIRRWWRLNPKADVRVLLHDSLERPMAVTGDYGKGASLLLATTAGPPWNDWQLRPEFLPWWHETLRKLWDQRYRFPNTTPEETSPEIIPEAAWSEEPGVYRSASGMPTVINVDPAEMNLRTFPLVWFWQHWPYVEAYLASSDRLSLVRRSYALWPWLWGIALLLACYEVWMSRAST